MTHPLRSAQQLDLHYSQSYYGNQNVKFVSLMERVVEWQTRRRAGSIGRRLQPSSTLLDIGCGRGLLLEALANQGHTCHGTERSALAASRAQKIPGISVYTEDLEHCPLGPGSLDLAILWHVLEHLQRPDLVLKETARLLKPGGLLVLEVPNLSSLQARFSRTHWFHLDLERHLYHFTREGLTGLLATHGFRIERVATLSLEQGPFGALQSFLNILGFPRDQLYMLLKRELEAPLAAKLVQSFLGTLLAIPAFLFSLGESVLGKGAVISVTARRCFDAADAPSTDPF